MIFASVLNCAEVGAGQRRDRLVGRLRVRHAAEPIRAVAVDTAIAEVERAALDGGALVRRDRRRLGRRDRRKPRVQVGDEIDDLRSRSRRPKRACKAASGSPTPSPWLMIFLSSAVVELLRDPSAPGTAGDAAPRPCRAWHCDAGGSCRSRGRRRRRSDPACCHHGTVGGGYAGDGLGAHGTPAQETPPSSTRPPTNKRESSREGLRQHMPGLRRSLTRKSSMTAESCRRSRLRRVQARDSARGARPSLPRPAILNLLDAGAVLLAGGGGRSVRSRGNRVATASAAAVNIGQLIALRPAPSIAALRGAPIRRRVIRHNFRRRRHGSLG